MDTAVAMKGYNINACVCFSVCVCVFMRALLLYTAVPRCLPAGVESGRSDRFVIHFSDVMGIRQRRCNLA